MIIRCLAEADVIRETIQIHFSSDKVLDKGIKVRAVIHFTINNSARRSSKELAGCLLIYCF